MKSLIYLDGLLALGLLFFRWALASRLKGLVNGRMIAIVLLVPALLMIVPKIEMAYACVAIIVMLAPSRPELCAGYLLMLAMVPELGVEYSVGGVYITELSTTLAMAVGALLGLIWTRRTTKLHTGKYDLAALALVFLLTIMTAHGMPATTFLRAFIDNGLSVGAPYIVVSRSIGSEQDARSVISRLYLAGALAAIIAIFEASRHWALYDVIPAHFNVAMQGISVLNIRAGFMRSGGPLLNPTAFALFLAVLPAGLWGVRSYFHKAGYHALTALLLLGLLSTQSRGGWIACAAGYCACWAYRGLRTRAIGALLGAVVVYFVAQYILPENGRLAESLGRSGAAAGTADYRGLLLESGIGQIKLHPVFGQSVTDLYVSMSHLIQGQGILDFVNAHLYVALTSGLVGLAVWILIWGTPFAASWKRGAPVGRDTASGLQIVPETILVVSMIGLIFTSTTVRALVWPTIGLAMTGPLLALAGHRRKSATRAGSARSPNLAVEPIKVPAVG
ncbi:O-antigen ligase family protein [Sphingomonas aliaeris]|uniref:O-antigen ligase family protein n=1 Tax=Sphingomonas aliaeris TaxID=2759526 RepID=UPI001CECB79A|nr:O-antigen ligase family protein [Sphingomonas aliaeris]